MRVRLRRRRGVGWNRRAQIAEPGRRYDAKALIREIGHIRQALIIAATAPWIATFMLLLVPPAAQTNSQKMMQSLLRDATIVADFASNPIFVIGDERVDGDALFQFYGLRNSRLAWSGKGRAVDAASAIRTLSTASDHGLDSRDYHLQQLADIDTAAR
jgi:hypothetical protein